MITLITGGPGTGKTAWLLDQLLDLKKNEPNRLLYIHGIRNLRGIPHQTIYCRSQLCDICRSQTLEPSSLYVEDWPKWKESNSLIVVDEVQRIWRPRTGGAAPHESVSGLETHRHYGVDFWLISQGPHLFDNFIRLLVGRHVHLLANWAGRKQYEWPECKQDVQSRTDAVVRTYKLPKRVFKLYDSAEVHTKQEKRKPLSFYFAIFAIILSITLVYFVTNRINSRLHPQDANATGAGGAIAATAPGTHLKSSGEKTILQTPEQVVNAFTPVIPSMPWTAPIYQEIAKPLSFPTVAGCVRNEKKCNCYTQQASLVDMPQDVCALFVKNHSFNPFKSPENKQSEINQKSNIVALKTE